MNIQEEGSQNEDVWFDAHDDGTPCEVESKEEDEDSSDEEGNLDDEKIEITIDSDRMSNLQYENSALLTSSYESSDSVSGSFTRKQKKSFLIDNIRNYTYILVMLMFLFKLDIVLWMQMLLEVPYMIML